MNRDQKTGVAERLLYGALLWLAMKAVGFGWINADMAAHIAAGGVALAGAAWAWYINRPVALMNSASDQLPKNSMLVITPDRNASTQERNQAADLATASNAKVAFKT